MDNPKIPNFLPLLAVLINLAAYEYIAVSNIPSPKQPTKDTSTHTIYTVVL